MPRITKVYTRTGDDGTTALGAGQRLSKDHPRIAAYGTVDELNAVLGVVLTLEVTEEVRAVLRRIQNELFHLGSDLCVPEEDKEKLPVPRMDAKHVDELEKDIDRFSRNLMPLENFILPGGCPAAAQLHVARTVCRRAERELVALAKQEAVGPHCEPYLNRLSDLLFVLARHENAAAGETDTYWNSRA